MNHWPFIIAAYGLTLGGTGLLFAWSFTTMRRAEKNAETVRKRA